ncbi:MAG TPA: hypothetical protein VGG33_11370 [Polyangia bacterium]
MSRNFRFSSLGTLGAVLGLATLLGCGTGEADDVELDEASYAERLAKLNACNLNDGTVEMEADVRACKPGNTKKTTICHVPPGNPANAHTLCIGNAAVHAHLTHHDDYLGPCKEEVMCPVPPPPPPSGAGGSSGGAGGAGGGPPNIGGIAGGYGAGGAAGGSGSGGTGGSVPDFTVD